ncbi:hypothetical protein Vi05172_g11794 [Venturia inaequalis]|nr:hypothetical protein Vi05172_g11794 [Venturia inaequalis]
MDLFWVVTLSPMDLAGIPINDERKDYTRTPPGEQLHIDLMEKQREVYNDLDLFWDPILQGNGR